MSSNNFFDVLEDVSSGDPVEIAKKKLQQKQAEAAKAAQQKKAETKTEDKKPQQKPAQKGVKTAPATKGPKTTSDAAPAAVTTDSAGFEQRDNRGQRRGRGTFKRVAPKTGRQFDRHSGTGRGKEIKKDGAGAHNWGKAGKEGAEKKPFLKQAKKDTKVETETPVTPVETEEKPVEETVETPKPEEEEVDNTITYDKLLEEKKKAKANKPKARKVGEAAVDPSLLKATEVFQKKHEEDEVIKVQGVDVKLAKKGLKSKKNQKKGQTITEFFKNDKDAIEALEQAHQWKGDKKAFRGGRGGKSTRGAPRGGRGGATRGRGKGPREPTPQFNSADFPTLK